MMTLTVNYPFYDGQKLNESQFIFPMRGGNNIQSENICKTQLICIIYMIFLKDVSWLYLGVTGEHVVICQTGHNILFV